MKLIRMNVSHGRNEFRKKHEIIFGLTANRFFLFSFTYASDRRAQENHKQNACFTKKTVAIDCFELKFRKQMLSLLLWL